MGTIKVYESFWKSDTRLALSLTICIWAIYSILKSQDEYSGLILSGMFGLFAASTIFSYFWRKPRLIIYDQVLKVNSPEPWVVHFDDVEVFYPTNYHGQEAIGICYKKDTENWKPEEEVRETRKSRIRYPENLHPGKPYEIYVTDLSLRCQQLCDMLNERLEMKG